MIECPRCGVRLPEEGLTTIEPAVCTTCGFEINPQRNKLGPGLIPAYFSDLWKIQFHPTLFFRHMPLKGGLTKPLAFALATHWLGASLGFLWRTMIGKSFFSQKLLPLVSGISSVSTSRHLGVLQHPAFLQNKDRILEWLSGVGPIILDPFLTLAGVLFSSFLLFVSARIFVSPGKAGHPEEISYETATKIICFGLSPSIFSAVPILGGLLSSFLIIIVTIAGIREVYRVSTGRAILIALFPKVIIPGIIVLGITLFLGFLFFGFQLIKLLMPSF